MKLMTIINSQTKGWVRSCMGQDGQEYVEFEVPGKVSVQLRSDASQLRVK